MELGKCAVDLYKIRGTKLEIGGGVRKAKRGKKDERQKAFSTAVQQQSHSPK